MATRDIALAASMAALYVVLSRLPGFPVVGVEGAQIGILSCVVPVFGFLLGPWLGAGAAFFGGLASRVLFGASPFSWMNLPALSLSAFVAGCLSRGKAGFVRGWVVGALVLGGLIFGWYVSWVGQIVWFFPFLHWVGLAIVLVFRERLAEMFHEEGRSWKLTIGGVLCGFVATMVAQMYGTLVFIVAAELLLVKASLSSTFFLVLFPVAVVERLVITAVIAVLGVPILLALRRHFGVG